jgi:phytoene synthase
MSIERAYEHCRRVTREAASNFYFGMRLLPPGKRRALWAVYAYSRRCDDAVDDHEGEQARAKLAEARRVAERAFGERYAEDHDPVALALGDAIRRYRMPREPFLALLAGMEMDLQARPYASFEELRLYCERVAGAVGVLCLSVFGYSDPAAPALAVDMGVALQLTNILRDLKEDSRRGRVYLPLDELAEAGYGVADLARGLRTPAFHHLMARQVARARAYFQRAAALFDLVDADARPCLMALCGVYREILDRIEGCGYDVFGRRVRLPTPRKLRLVGSLLWQQRRPRGA